MAVPGPIPRALLASYALFRQLQHQDTIVRHTFSSSTVFRGVGLARLLGASFTFVTFSVPWSAIIDSNMWAT